MVWKSREDKLPPPSFFSLLVAHLQAAYPGARISREVMMTLRPYFVDAWRQGKSAQSAAQTMCSCDGREIVPSPVVGVQISKGAVRPPLGAQRGEVFGADELREAAPVERLQRQLNRVSREQAKLQNLEMRWGQRARTARKDTTRSEAERQQAGAASRYSELLAEAQRIEAELQRTRGELGRAARMERAVEHVPALPPVVSPPSPPVERGPRPPQAQNGPSPKRRGRPPRTAASGKDAASDGAANEAMLSAIRGLLPDVAAQMAAQMAKDEGGKT
ncbi:MAG: hypothetical protein U1A78_19135 [Polyangia bacterium]